MKEMKEILTCVVPFMVAAALVYPFMAIIGGDLDPFLWARDDSIFYFVCTTTFGVALLYRIMYVRGQYDGQ